MFKPHFRGQSKEVEEVPEHKAVTSTSKSVWEGTEKWEVSLEKKTRLDGKYGRRAPERYLRPTGG